MNEKGDDPVNPAPAQPSSSGAHLTAGVTPQGPPVLPPGVRAPGSLSGVETYNVVSDTVIGVNVRGKDNLFQFLAIVAGVILGIGIGMLVSPRDRISGAVFGGFAGLLGGLLLSGIALMIYRAVRHASGKHD